MTPHFRGAIEFGRGVPFGLGVVGVATVALLPFRQAVEPSFFMLACILLIVTVARLAGAMASTAAAVLAFLALDFLYVAPFYRLSVSRSSELLALLVFLVVALVLGRQTGRLRERERAAVQRTAELELLNALASRVSSSTSPESIARFTVDEVAQVLGANRVALYLVGDTGRAPRELASAGDGRPGTDEATTVATVIRNAAAFGLPGSSNDARVLGAVPLCFGSEARGALVVGRRNGRWSPDAERLLLSAAHLASASLERLRLLDEAAKAGALAEADTLKSTFVSSISHELKTPLAAATMRITGLLDEGVAADSGRVRMELAAVASELQRLDASIGDLLLFSRLEADAWRPHFDVQELSEVVGVVLDRLPEHHKTRIRFDMGKRLPAISMDLAQVARAYANLVNNALQYSPADAPVTLGTGKRAGAVELWVEDRGQGVSDEEKPHLTEKFYRGAAAAFAPAGTGLGLAISAEIAEAHGGRIVVEDAKPSGARISIVLPATEGR